MIRLVSDTDAIIRGKPQVIVGILFYIIHIIIYQRLRIPPFVCHCVDRICQRNSHRHSAGITAYPYIILKVLGDGIDSIAI